MGRAIAWGFVIVMFFAILGQKLAENGRAPRPATTNSAATPVVATPSKAPATTPEDMAYTMIQMAKKKVPVDMKDPSSATFRDLFAVKTPAGGVLVCGSVNGRNSFNGFTGFGKFMWTPSITVFEENMKPREFVKAWNGSCGKWPTIATAKS